MTLAPRLTALLDVLQQCHDCKRSVACRIVADKCGVSWRYIHNLATNNVRILGKRPARVNSVALAQPEARYRVQLDLLAAYQRACAAYAVRRAA